MRLPTALMGIVLLLAAPSAAAASFTGLVTAARLDNIEAARSLLDAGTGPNGGLYGFPNGYSPLMWAARHDNADLATLLLERGARTEHRDHNGDRALLWAAYHGAGRVVALLLEAGSPADSDDDPHGRTPLMRAAEYGRAGVVRLLLAAGADPNRLDQSGETALHNAALRQWPEVVRLLLDAGADAGVVDTILHETPLHEAAAFAGDAVVEMLIAAGAPLDLRNGDGETPLHIAAGRGLPRHVEALLAAGANPDLADKRGVSPLRAAIGGKRHEVWDNDGAALPLARVAAGIDAALPDALAAGMAEVAQVLLARGADPDARDRHGRPALAAAAELPDAGMLETLLAAGAGLGEAGVEALFAAAVANRPASLDVLLGQGVALEARDAHGATPLLRAAGAGAVAAVRLLLERGADPGLRDAAGRGIEDHMRPPPALRLPSDLRPQLRMRSAKVMPRIDHAGLRGAREARLAAIRALIAQFRP
jgi:ankyrin repeat protein